MRIGGAFVHRIKRLYPVYLTVIAFAVLLSLITKVGNASDSVWYVLAAQNFRCIFSGDWVSLDFLLGHFWYIALDVWLFLAWIVLLKYVPRKFYRLAFIISLLIGLCWRTCFLVLIPDNLSISYVIPLGMLDSFALGGLVALNTKERGGKDFLMWSELIVGAVGVGLLTIYNACLHNCSLSDSYQLYQSAGGYMHDPLTGNTYFFVALFFAGVIRYCVDTEKKHPFLSWTPVVALGGLTYELYCFHFPIRTLAQHFITNDLIMLLSTLLLTVLAAILWKKWAAPIVGRIIH